MSAAWDLVDDLMDEINDTDALRSCSCPSCNHYAPDYADHMDEQCAVWVLINRYADARAVAEMEMPS